VFKRIKNAIGPEIRFEIGLCFGAIAVATLVIVLTLFGLQP
jgi:hypothetical protein